MLIRLRLHNIHQPLALQIPAPEGYQGEWQELVARYAKAGKARQKVCLVRLRPLGNFSRDATIRGQKYQATNELLQPPTEGSAEEQVSFGSHGVLSGQWSVIEGLQAGVFR